MPLRWILYVLIALAVVFLVGIGVSGIVHWLEQIYNIFVDYWPWIDVLF